jgi:hypothetical protein
LFILRINLPSDISIYFVIFWMIFLKLYKERGHMELYLKPSIKKRRKL